ncbi:hypothetical protein HYS29_01935 [Candidatus Microgenomates bacterium]|nr:hypothetical protein [Candidatus Microgenomates bacterium]
MKVAIIGNGNWGEALGQVLADNRHQVSYWKEGKIIRGGVVLLAVPTPAIRQVLPYVTKSKNLIIINSAKGIENTTHQLPFQIVKEVLGKNIAYFSLIGPSFAEEVVKKMPTLVNLGYFNSHQQQLIKSLFQTPYFRLRLTKAVEAIELSGALKNVYAIACGLAEGLGFGANTRAKLIVLALEEIHRLIGKLGYKMDSLCTPGTLGDLILTSTSFESRNYTFGSLLAKYSKEKSLAKVNSTVEGYNTALSIPYFVKKTGFKLTLANLVCEIISANSPKEARSKFYKFVGGVN